MTTGIQQYRPVNLKHQQNYGASIRLALTSKQLTDRYFISGAIVSETKSNSTLKQAGIDLFFERAIYPNTRTTISFYLRSQAGYQDAGQVSNFYTGADLSGLFHYFISYRTRLNCNVGASYQKNMLYSYNTYVQLLPNNFQLHANAGVEINL